MLNLNVLKIFSAFWKKLYHPKIKSRSSGHESLEYICIRQCPTVHFPTDYNLLWDSARKCLTIVSHLLERQPRVQGWREIENWQKELKNLTRSSGQISAKGGSNKTRRINAIALIYLTKARLLSEKIKKKKHRFLSTSTRYFLLLMELDLYESYPDKHIDLLNRRILKLADRLLEKYNINSISFDKGFFKKAGKELLKLFIPEVIMPKKGTRTMEKTGEETRPRYKRSRNKHSAIESKINELENRVLNKRPDKGYAHFKRYIGLGVLAYNLCKIGRELLKQNRQQTPVKLKKAA